MASSRKITEPVSLLSYVSQGVYAQYEPLKATNKSFGTIQNDTDSAVFRHVPSQPETNGRVSHSTVVPRS